MKARIFVDFWNFQLTLNEVSPGFRLDWVKLSPWLVNAASNLIGQNLSFEETTVYISYDPHSENDRRLHHWARNVLDRFPGIQVVVLERKPKRPPVCPCCHTPIVVCPHCRGPITAMVEKGVDTSIVTDLLNLAWESAWDVAILISSDRDFIPAVTQLQTKGFRVINAHFPPKGMDLARTCWASLDLRTALSDLARG
jgi:uncharacterized LabA/DUF88 family protein